MKAFHESGLNESIQERLKTLALLLKIPVPTLEVIPVEPQEWLSIGYQQLIPQRCGQYYIYGEHREDPPRDGRVPLKINASTAFGSGEHPTTQGCLLAFHDLKKRYSFRSILDMGCGSGILAIAGAKTWKAAYVWGADCDLESVRMARENSILNHLPRSLRIVRSRGFSQLDRRTCPHFDLIVANILATPLCQMAKDVKRFLNINKNKYRIVILSGLLFSQKNKILNFYRAQGLFLIKEYRKEEWSTLVLESH